MTIEVKNN